MKVSVIKYLFVTVASLNEVATKGDDTPTFVPPTKGAMGGLSNSNDVPVLVMVKGSGMGAQSFHVLSSVTHDKTTKVSAQVDDSLTGYTMSQENFEKLVSQSDGTNLIVEMDHEKWVSKKPVSLRKLAETMPWGIPKVLEDLNFWDSISDPTGPQMAVCVADTGYDLGHVDLPTGSDVDGTDNYGSSWSSDGHGHGTHCSGTVAAIGNNDKGVPGVIPNNKGGKFKLIIGKALSNSGSGSSSGVMAAVGHCIAKGAKVISMSLGCSSCYTQSEDAFYQTKYNEGKLIIAAAGNSGPGVVGYPSSYASVVSVASLTDQVNSDPTRSSFSQTNDQLEISAPGKDVLSTIPGNSYDSWSGTSMACPHVAGVAGLVWMYFPECTNVQIRHVLDKTAYPLGDLGCDEEFGYGMVQAKAAYDLLSEGNCGGELGFQDPSEAKGGCEELYGTPAPTPSPCTGPSDCDDGNSCTTDNCDLSTGICSNIPLASGNVEVSVTTDAYPGETTWDIVTPDGNQVMAGGPYSQSGTTYTDNEELLGCNIDYVFTIKDGYGDGICCSYGEGGYTVTVEDEVVAEGGTFGSSEATNFNINTLPTSAPVASPTAPCIECTNNPTNNMISKGKTCETVNNLTYKCTSKAQWRNNKYCQLSCYEAGVGYAGDVCCQSQS